MIYYYDLPKMLPIAATGGFFARYYYDMHVICLLLCVGGVFV